MLLNMLILHLMPETRFKQLEKGGTKRWEFERSSRVQARGEVHHFVKHVIV